MTSCQIGRRRRGAFLIELLVTITVLTVLLGLGAGLLHILLRLDQKGREALDVAADQARLVEAFRADVHAATLDPAPAVEADHLTLTDAQTGRIDYTIRPHDLLREVHQGNKLRQREVYRLTSRSQARFETTREADRPWVVLRIDPSIIKTSGRGVRIEAEAGRSARWIGGKP